MPDNMNHHKAPTPCYAFRLFVAGDAPNSRIARANLRRLQERVPVGTFDVEVVDVLENPQVALANGVFLTPALQILLPAPGALIFGNLSNTDLLATMFPEDARDDGSP